MTAQDKVEIEDKVRASELFTRDLTLFECVLETVRQMKPSLTPHYNTVLGWIHAAAEFAPTLRRSEHDIARDAFLSCINSLKETEARIPLAEAFEILNGAVLREISIIGRVCPDSKSPQKYQRGRPPRPSIFEQSSSLKGFPV